METVRGENEPLLLFGARSKRNAAREDACRQLHQLLTGSPPTAGAIREFISTLMGPTEPPFETGQAEVKVGTPTPQVAAPPPPPVKVGERVLIRTERDTWKPFKVLDVYDRREETSYKWWFVGPARKHDQFPILNALDEGVWWKRSTTKNAKKSKANPVAAPLPPLKWEQSKNSRYKSVTIDGVEIRAFYEHDGVGISSWWRVTNGRHTVVTGGANRPYKSNQSDPDPTARRLARKYANG